MINTFKSLSKMQQQNQSPVATTSLKSQMVPTLVGWEDIEVSYEVASASGLIITVDDKIKAIVTTDDDFKAYFENSGKTLYVESFDQYDPIETRERVLNVFHFV